MKLLFCHDGPIEKDKSGEFYGIGFNDELFERYECISNDISIAMRVHNTIITDKTKFLKLSSKRYNVIELPNISSLKGMFFNKMKCYRILKESIIANDAIIIRLPSFIGNIAVNIAEKYKKPYLVEVVGCPWDALWNHSAIGKFVAPFMYLKTKKNVNNAKFVLYVTQTFLQKRYPTNGKSIGCSDVKLEEIFVEEELNKRKDKINKMGNRIVLGTIGVLNIKYKGQEYVIRAIADLKKLGYDIEYQLVGSGDNARLKRIAKKYKVEKNINFIGALKHNEIFNWLEDIDIYIQPSTTEGMPRALIEAMSKACPCIGSNVGGIPELLGDDCVFKSKNVNSLIDIIKSFDIEKMKREANENINKVKMFDNNDINRQNFYKKFVGMYNGKKQ